MFIRGKPDVALIVYTNVSDRSAESEFRHIRDSAGRGIDKSESVFGAVEEALIRFRVFDVAEIRVVPDGKRADLF